MTRSIDGVALVTGGAGGLGAAAVRRLVTARWRVVVFDRSAPRAGELVDELGGEAVAVAGDVGDDLDVARAIDRATELGSLRAVVNVAGGGVGGGMIVRSDGTPHDPASFADTMTMNVAGTFNVARLAAAAMSGRPPDDDGGRGVIVNTASIAGYEGQRGQVAYAAAKAAILGMTLPMSRDLAPLGIRVCAVAPGPMGTPAMRKVIDRLDVNPAAGTLFPARMGSPDEFADAVVAIVDNGYLNGENVRLDGGLRLAATDD